MTARPRLLAIDGTALAFRAFFAIPGLTDSQGRPSGALYGYLSSLLRILEDHQAGAAVVTWDLGDPTFRHKMSKEYKATRERMDEDLVVQLPWMRQVTDLLGLTQLDQSGFEADDLMASLAEQGSAQGFEVRICSGDKDMAQLVTDQIFLYPPPRRNDQQQVLGPAEIHEKYGVPPEWMAQWQALVGDSSDNVKGMPSVGPKRATTLLNKYQSLDAVLERGPVEEKGKLAENLAEHADSARLALELVTMRKDLNVGEAPSWNIQDPKKDQVRAFCQEHNFDSLAARFSSDSQEVQTEPSVVSDRTDHLVNTTELLVQLRDGLQSSDGFAVDTETTSLDPVRADLVGMSFSWQKGEAWYVPCNLDPPLCGPKNETPVQFLAPILADRAIPKIGQNGKYDAHVLERAGAPVRGWTFDTMLAHFLADPLSPHNLDALAMRYLGIRKIPTEELIGKGKDQITMAEVAIEKLARYACEDAENTWQLFPIMREELAKVNTDKIFHTIEMPLMEVLQRMESAGIRVDPDRLAEMDQRLTARLATLEAFIFDLGGEELNLQSPKQLGPLLFDKLRIQDEVGVKRPRKTKTGWSTSAAALEPYHGLPIVDSILNFRRTAKLRGTYVEALPKWIHPQTGLIHTSFLQTGASTGRLASHDPNLQNIPNRTEEGREIRRAFVPLQAGWTLLSADYSQIELRVVAHLADDPTLSQAFRDGADVHARTAGLVFGVAEKDVTSEMRNRAKTINFGILYGMGPQRLARELKISFSEAQKFIDAYFRAMPQVREWLDATLAQAEKEGEVRTLFGRRRPMPELLSDDGRLRAAAANAAVNTPVQGTAADLIKLAMIRIDARIHREIMEARMLLQVHDELLFDCPLSEVANLTDLVREEMEGVAELTVPLKVEIGTGSDWAEAH